MKPLKKSTAVSRRSVNVRVPEDLFADLEAVRLKARQMGLQFNASQVAIDAWRKAVKAAEKQISQETGREWSAKDQQLDFTQDNPGA